MAEINAYLETTSSGACMVHVLDLPGCFATGADRDAALDALAGAIQAYRAWLWRHGEQLPGEDEPLEVEIAEEHDDSGPFHPGDPAALFGPEREPLSDEHMESCFRIAAHSRSDLLGLVQDLPDEVLDWRPGPEELSIRQTLRHIGNAEEWYVSRICLPDTLPKEWKDDDLLPLFEFLGMERRTTQERLRQLSESERSDVFHPSQWTSDQTEPWTARKVLRRYLEHEREHTAHITDILTAWQNR